MHYLYFSVKKALIIFLLFIYTLASFGIGVRQFYCCGKLKSVNLTYVQTKNGKCKMGNEKTGCCKTKFQSIKVKDAHIAAEKWHHLTKVFIPVFHQFFQFAVVVPTQYLSAYHQCAHAPPISAITPLYQLNCVYRI